MQYQGWFLDPVTKVNKITVRCYPPGERSPGNYVQFDYLYEEVRNIEGAVQQARYQIDVIQKLLPNNLASS